MALDNLPGGGGGGSTPEEENDQEESDASSSEDDVARGRRRARRQMPGFDEGNGLGSDDGDMAADPDDMAGLDTDPFRAPGTDGGSGDSSPEDDQAEPDGDGVDDQAGRDDDPFRAPGTDGGSGGDGTVPDDDGGGDGARDPPQGGGGGGDQTPDREPETGRRDAIEAEPETESVVVDASTESQARAQATQATGLSASELDITQADGGGFRVTFASAETRAAQQLDDQLSGVDVGPGDVEAVGDGEFRLTESAQERAAAERAADEFDITRSDLAIENGRVVPQTDAGASAIAEATLQDRTPAGTDVDSEVIGPGVVTATGDIEGLREVGTDGEADTSLSVATPEGEQFLNQVETYEDVEAALRQQARDADAVDAAEAAENAAQAAREDLDRGSLGDANEIREERVASELSDDVGVELTDEDVTVREADGEGYEVDLQPRAQRAASLATSADFLRRDVEIGRTDSGEFDVDLRGDSPELEEALTQRVNQGEAFGGETTVSAFGQTLNVEDATEDVANAFERGAGDAVEVLDDLNAFDPRNRGAFVDDGEDPATAADADTLGEASETFLLNRLEGAGAALGEIPKGALEAGEAATDPLFYRTVAEADESLALDDLEASDLTSAADGTVETLERADEAAQENPEAGTAAVGALLSGGLTTVATGGAASAGLTRLGSVSPTAARGLEAALDPLRTGARGATRVSRTVAPDVDGRARSVLGDRDPLDLDAFREDTRGMADLTGRQRSRGDDADGDADDELGVPDDDPFRKSDARLFDPARSFERRNDPSVDVDPTDRSGEALDDIQGGLSGRGDPEAAPGVDLPEGGFSARGFGRTETSTGDASDIRDAAERFEVTADADADLGPATRASQFEIGADVSVETAGLLASDAADDALFASDALDDLAEADASAIEDAASFDTTTDADGLLGTESAVGTDATVGVDTRSDAATETAEATDFANAFESTTTTDTTTRTATDTVATVTVDETAQATQFTAQGTGTPRRRRGRTDFDLSDPTGLDDDVLGGDDPTASELFENPTISPEEAVGFDPLGGSSNGRDSEADSVGDDLDALF